METSSTTQPIRPTLCGIMADVNCTLLFAFLLIWTVLLAYLIAVTTQMTIFGTPPSWCWSAQGIWALLIQREVYIVSLHDFAKAESIIAGAYLRQSDAEDAIKQILELDYQGRQLWCDDIRHAMLDNTEHGILIKLPQGYENFSGIMAAIHKMSLR